MNSREDSKYIDQLSRARASERSVVEQQKEDEALEASGAHQPKGLREALKKEEELRAKLQEAEAEKQRGVLLFQEGLAKQRALELKRAAIEQAKQVTADTLAWRTVNDTKLEDWTSPQSSQTPRHWLGDLMHARIIIERKLEFLSGWIARQQEQLKQMEADLAAFCIQHGIEQLPG